MPRWSQTATTKSCSSVSPALRIRPMPVPPGPPSRKSSTGASAPRPRIRSDWSCPPMGTSTSSAMLPGRGDRLGRGGTQEPRRAGRARPQCPEPGGCVRATGAGRGPGAVAEGRQTEAGPHGHRQEHQDGVHSPPRDQHQQAVDAVEVDPVDRRAVHPHPDQLEDDGERQRGQQQCPTRAGQPADAEPQPEGGQQGQHGLDRGHRSPRDPPPCQRPRSHDRHHGERYRVTAGSGWRACALRWREASCWPRCPPCRGGDRAAWPSAP